MIDSLLWGLGSGGMVLGHCMKSIFFSGDVVLLFGPEDEFLVQQPSLSNISPSDLPEVLLKSSKCQREA